MSLGKRLFDIAFASSVLLCTAPMLALAVLMIRTESSGPAIFRQKRMGAGGRVFNIYKLRGMFIDARERFPELYDYASHEAGTAESFFFHEAGDPRVTRVGRIVRKLSIDELPNFVNVLRGEMSVVGPRPEIPELAHLYGEALPELLSVRPGVTSPAKARGRDSLSLEETIQLDLSYIERQSLLLDLRTIAQTFMTTITAKDAS